MSYENQVNSEKFAIAIDARIRALPDINVPTVRPVRREFSKQLAKSQANTVINIAEKLITYPTFTHRWVAYELIQEHKPALQSLNEMLLDKFGQGMNSWAWVDTFSLYLAGPAWRNGQISDDVIHRWARSPDRWWRRTALVCTVALNSKARGGSGDSPRTLKVCEILADDRDDMVVKALSWALRELSKHDPQAARNFLAAYENKLAARVIREVSNKLQTGLKNP